MNQIPFSGLKISPEATKCQFYVQTHSLVTKATKTCLISFTSVFLFARQAQKCLWHINTWKSLWIGALNKTLQGTVVREGGRKNWSSGDMWVVTIASRAGDTGAPQKLPHRILFNSYSSSDDKLLYFFPQFISKVGYIQSPHTKQKITSFWLKIRVVFKCQSCM